MKTSIKLLSFLLFFLLSLPSYSQNSPKFVKGKVTTPRGGGHQEIDPLPGATVMWKGTQKGAMTDAFGLFKLPTEGATDTLVFSFVGYQTGFVLYEGQSFIEVTLSPGEMLEAAEVVERGSSTRMEMLNPLIAQTIDSRELTKAACCNLSESFETNASVDAAYTDAVTGTRQIKMLGLDGKYVEMLKDNIPAIRGLQVVRGLYDVPGPFVNQISISKGVGSVTSGYESMTGQINVAQRNAMESPKFHLNLYGNQGGRMELNALTRHTVGRKWATSFKAHGMYNDLERDNNGDGFMDNVLIRHTVLAHDWKFQGDRNIEGMYSITGSYTEQEAGQLSSLAESSPTDLWRARMDSKSLEVFAKTGYVSPQFEWRSIGTQFSGNYYNQRSVLGDRTYYGEQISFRGNVMYSTIISNTNHKLTTGASFIYDDFNESLDSVNYQRAEQVPGVYTEYTWNHEERMTLVAGMRVDQNNLYGLFWTPRLHFRYSLTENTSVKMVGGKGYRTANAIIENTGQLASARNWVILGEQGEKGFGLDPEIAWNYGINFLQKFRLAYRDASLSLDFYRTDFENQVITDLENPREIRIYNLEGKSFSNSAQAEFDWSPFRRFDVRVAYRWLEVMADYRDAGRLDLPLVSTHRAFANIAYETKRSEKGAQWRADMTLQWIGDQRLPNTSANPENYQLDSRSDDYYMLNAQVTRAFKEGFELYVGGENLLNFRQPNAILAAEEPNGEYFDASLVWGPVFGAMVYGGLRWNID